MLLHKQYWYTGLCSPRVQSANSTESAWDVQVTLPVSSYIYPHISTNWAVLKGRGGVNWVYEWQTRREKAGEQQRERERWWNNFYRDVLCSCGSDCAEAVGVMQSQWKEKHNNSLIHRVGGDQLALSYKLLMIIPMQNLLTRQRTTRAQSDDVMNLASWKIQYFCKHTSLCSFFSEANTL